MSTHLGRALLRVVGLDRDPVQADYALAPGGYVHVVDAKGGSLQDSRPVIVSPDGTTQPLHEWAKASTVQPHQIAKFRETRAGDWVCDVDGCRGWLPPTAHRVGCIGTTTGPIHVDQLMRRATDEDTNARKRQRRLTDLRRQLIDADTMLWSEVMPLVEEARQLIGKAQADWVFDIDGWVCPKCGRRAALYGSPPRPVCVGQQHQGARTHIAEPMLQVPVGQRPDDVVQAYLIRQGTTARSLPEPGPLVVTGVSREYIELLTGIQLPAATGGTEGEPAVLTTARHQHPRFTLIVRQHRDRTWGRGWWWRVMRHEDLVDAGDRYSHTCIRQAQHDEPTHAQALSVGLAELATAYLVDGLPDPASPPCIEEQL